MFLGSVFWPADHLTFTTLEEPQKLHTTDEYDCFEIMTFARKRVNSVTMFPQGK